MKKVSCDIMSENKDKVCSRVSKHIFEIGVEECGSAKDFFEQIAPFFGIEPDDFEIEDEDLEYLKNEDWDGICKDLEKRNRRVMSLAHRLNEENEEWSLQESLKEAWDIAAENCPNF